MHIMTMAPEVYVSEHFDDAVAAACEAAGLRLSEDDITIRITGRNHDDDDMVVATTHPDVVRDVISRVTAAESE